LAKRKKIGLIKRDFFRLLLVVVDTKGQMCQIVIVKASKTAKGGF